MDVWVRMITLRNLDKYTFVRTRWIYYDTDNIPQTNLDPQQLDNIIFNIDLLKIFTQN